MTDEEYGRAYADQMGWEPAENYERGMFAWLGDDYGDAKTHPEAVLPSELSHLWGFPGYRPEGSAYSALGRAVRRIHTAVPPLNHPLLVACRSVLAKMGEQLGNVPEDQNFWPAYEELKTAVKAAESGGDEGAARAVLPR